MHLQRASPAQLDRYMAIALKVAQDEIESVNIELASLWPKLL
jgi:hypothetical protein